MLDMRTEARNLRWALMVRVTWKKWEEHRSERTTEFRVDDPLFTKFADFAKVPAGGREILRQGVCYELSDLQAQRSPPPRELGSNKRALIQLRRLAKFSREISAIASSLDNQALKHLLLEDWHRQRRIWEENFRAFHNNTDSDLGPPPPPPTAADWRKTRWRNFQNTIAELADLSAEASSLLQKKPPPRAKGRPCHGSFSSVFSGSLVEFTFRLLLHVRASGGRLTLDKNAATGSLLDALELLRPCLPPKFLPRILPLSTLARVKALDQKIAPIKTPA